MWISSFCQGFLVLWKQIKLMCWRELNMSWHCHYVLIRGLLSVIAPAEAGEGATALGDRYISPSWRWTGGIVTRFYPRIWLMSSWIPVVSSFASSCVSSLGKYLSFFLFLAVSLTPTCFPTQSNWLKLFSWGRLQCACVYVCVVVRVCEKIWKQE